MIPGKVLVSNNYLRKYANKQKRVIYATKPSGQIILRFRFYFSNSSTLTQKWLVIKRLIHGRNHLTCHLFWHLKRWRRRRFSSFSCEDVTQVALKRDLPDQKREKVSLNSKSLFITVDRCQGQLWCWARHLSLPAEYSVTCLNINLCSYMAYILSY